MVVDARKVRSGDRVVFAHPDNGYPRDIEVAAEAGLEIGRKYSVAEVDLGSCLCRLRLAGVGWFNSVQFDAE